MKTIGLIGGTTWVSTIDYYKYINRMTTERLGGIHSAKILLSSVDFEEFKPPSDPAVWKQRGEQFSAEAMRLEKSGADCILLCANTAHIVADTVRNSVRVPLIHIGEETAKEIAKSGVKKVALLGTKFTMEHTFYPEQLSKRGIETLTPDKDDREYINGTIFGELIKEQLHAATKQNYLGIIKKLEQRGAKGVIFGCTEIPLLLKPSDCDIPTFDTTMIHSRAAVDFALS